MSKKGSVSLMKEKPYNRQAAVAYAQKWALDRNPRYYDFQNIGGDCTNFVSQCLFAGAGVMNFTPTFGWYYLSPSNRAPAWTGVVYLYNFLTTNRSVGPYARVVSPEDIEQGDIIQLGNSNGNFYHSLLVTAVTPEILICTHTYDALNAPLSSYFFDQARFLHIEGVRVWN